MRDPTTFRNLAASFRKLAETADEATAARMRALADEYDQMAVLKEIGPTPSLETPS